MNLIEMQIMFHQKAEAINAQFFDRLRPTSFEIVNYFNKAIDRYVRDKFLSLPTHEMRRNSVLAGMDVLRDMVEHQRATVEDTSGTLPFAFSKRIILPPDMLCLLGVYGTYSRSAVPPMTSDVVFSELTPMESARRLATSDADKPIYPRPIAALENEFNLLLIGDAYTTDITNIAVRYLRKHFELSFNYRELEGAADGADLTINSIVADTNYFRALAKGTYYSDPSTQITVQAGQKLVKVTGRNNMEGTSFPNWKQKIGAPYGMTDTPEFPEYMHEEIVDLGVQMFMDEAKLKLTPKAQSA